MTEVLRNRPLLVLAIGFLLGLSMREHPWNALLFVPLAILVHIPSKCLILASGLAVGLLLSPQIPNAGVDSRQPVKGEAVVVTVPRLYPDRIAYEIEIQGHRLTATEPSGSGRSLGDRLKVEGQVRPLREGTEEFLLAKGIVGRFKPSSVQVMSEGPSWYRAALTLRQKFVEFTKTSMSPQGAAILDALCFNVEGGLSDDFEEDLRSTGTIHIISASGLHVLLIAVAIDWLLGLLPVPRPVRLILLGLLLAFYAAAAGLQPAIVRSILMSLVALTAYLWRREADLLSSLSLAAVAYLLWEPRGVFNIGFQISFLTVAAFALFGQFGESFPKTAVGALKDQSTEAFKTSMVAFAATLPLLIFYFGSASLIAIPANLAIIPAVMVLVIGGLAAFAVSTIVPAFGSFIASFLLTPLTNYLEWVLNQFGNLSNSSAQSSAFSGYWLVLAYAILSLWVHERVRPC